MDKTSYALGMSIAHNLMSSGVKDLTIDDFAAGLKAILTGAKPALSFEEAGSELNAFFSKLEEEQAAIQAKMAEQFKAEGEAWLKGNAQKEGVTVLPSGLQYRVIKHGDGKKPGPTSKVQCHYEGTLIDGTKFDSSYDRNEPAVFGVNQVIAGWTEALQLMKEGSVWELMIPYQLAYGEQGAGQSIPPCATLIFKVELLKVL